ncbi:MAG: hypothetical protein RSB67_00300 [Clostridia bacterium]
MCNISVNAHLDDDKKNIVFITGMEYFNTTDMLKVRLRKKKKQFSIIRNVLDVPFILSYASTYDEIKNSVVFAKNSDYNLFFTTEGFIFCGDEEIASKLYISLTKNDIFLRVLSCNDESFFSLAV